MKLFRILSYAGGLLAAFSAPAWGAAACCAPAKQVPMACCAPAKQAPAACCATDKEAPKACCVPGEQTAANCCAEGGANCCAKDDATAGSQATAAHPVLSVYTRLSDALVEDNLATAKSEAAALAEAARTSGETRISELAAAVAGAESLADAREQLVALSQDVIAIAADLDGYFVMQCPMVRNGQWLQADRDIRNPYMGQRMVRCGMVQRPTGS